jgi:hypothetical protein
LQGFKNLAFFPARIQKESFGRFVGFQALTSPTSPILTSAKFFAAGEARAASTHRTEGHFDGMEL